MNRRVALRTVGASILAGATVTGSAAANDDPRVVAVESEPASGNVGDGRKYAVTYRGNETVEITGEITVPESCYGPEVVGVESTPFGDVVRVRMERTGDVCLHVVTRLGFRIELEYAEAADDVFLEFVDE